MRPARRDPRRPPRLRFGWACAFALLALVGQVGWVAHFALASHRVCAEHGEVVDVAHGRAQSTAPTLALATLAPPDPVDGFRAGEEDEGDHDHCLLGLTRRERAGIEPPVRLDEPVVARLGFLPSTDVAVRPARALLLAAPKTSPPAAIG